jgi:transposase-like protein
MAKTAKSARRYSAAERKRILDTARAEGLTGAQVQARFGVSPLTFYRWRGPVGRGRKADRARDAGRAGRTGTRVRASSRHGVVETAELDLIALREEVRRALNKVLPRVVEEEIEAYIAALLRSG